MRHVTFRNKHLRQNLLGFWPPRIAMLLVTAAAILHLVLPISVAPRLQTAAILSGLAGFAAYESRVRRWL